MSQHVTPTGTGPLFGARAKVAGAEHDRVEALHVGDIERLAAREPPRFSTDAGAPLCSRRTRPSADTASRLSSAPRTKARKWERADIAVRRRGRGVALRSLVPEPLPDQTVEVMKLEPGAGLGGTPHLPGTRELFSRLEDSVTVFVAGTSYDVAAGEVLAFPGSAPHSYRNRDAMNPALGVSVVVFAKAGV